MSLLLCIALLSQIYAPELRNFTLMLISRSAIIWVIVTVPLAGRVRIVNKPVLVEVSTPDKDVSCKTTVVIFLILSLFHKFD